MSKSCEEKQQELIKRFSLLKDKEAKYKEIIECSHFLPPFPEEQKKDCHLVKGCQSLLYVTAVISEGKIFFQAYSDSLISKGLAGLLTYIYSGEDPKTLLLCPPKFLQEIDIFSSLSMNRSQGLRSLIAQMQKIAISFIN